MNFKSSKRALLYPRVLVCTDTKNQKNGVFYGKKEIKQTCSD